MNQIYHHGNLRHALLARAEEALQEVGIDGLSLRQLARDIGVSHAAPARHFRDKQALLDALALEGFEALNAALADAVGGGGSFRERFDRMARAYVTFAVERPDLLHLMYTTKHRESAGEMLRQTGEAGMVTARDLIAQAQAAHEVRAGDPWMLAAVAHAQMHGIAVLASGGMLPGMETDAILDVAIDLFWRGLKG